MKYAFATSVQLAKFRTDSVVLSSEEYASDRMMFILFLLYEWDYRFNKDTTEKKLYLSNSQILSLIKDIKPEGSVLSLTSTSSLYRGIFQQLIALGLIVKSATNHNDLRPDLLPYLQQTTIKWNVTSLFDKESKYALCEIKLYELFLKFDECIKKEKETKKELPVLDKKSSTTDNFNEAHLIFSRTSYVLNNLQSYKEDRNLIVLLLLIEFQLQFPNVTNGLSKKDIVNLLEMKAGIKFDQSSLQVNLFKTNKLLLSKRGQIKVNIETCKSATSITWIMQSIERDSRKNRITNYNLANSVLELEKGLPLKNEQNSIVLSEDKTHQTVIKKEDSISPELTPLIKVDPTPYEVLPWMEKDAIDQLTMMRSINLLKKRSAEGLTENIFKFRKRKSNIERMPELIEQAATVAANIEQMPELVTQAATIEVNHEQESEFLTHVTDTKIKIPQISDVKANVEDLPEEPTIASMKDYSARKAILPEFGTINKEEEKLLEGSAIEDFSSEEINLQEHKANQPLEEKKKIAIFGRGVQRLLFLGRAHKVELSTAHFTGLEGAINLAKGEQPSERFVIYQRKFALAIDLICKGHYPSALMLLKEAYTHCLDAAKKEEQTKPTHFQNAQIIAKQLKHSIDLFGQLAKKRLRVDRQRLVDRDVELFIADFEPFTKKNSAGFQKRKLSEIKYAKDIVSSQHRGRFTIRNKRLVEDDGKTENLFSKDHPYAQYIDLISQAVYGQLTEKQLDQYIAALNAEYNSLISNPETTSFEESVSVDEDVLAALTTSETYDPLGEKWDQMELMKDNEVDGVPQHYEEITLKVR